MAPAAVYLPEEIFDQLPAAREHPSMLIKFMLDAADPIALAAALRRNIYPQVDEKAPEMEGLAGWMMDVSTQLAAQSEETIATGSLTLPLPGR